VSGDPSEPSAIEERILARAEHWMKICVAERPREIADGVF